MMLKDHTEGIVQNYCSWVKRFEDLQKPADVSPTAGVLEEFDELLQDKREMKRFEKDYVDENSVWNGCRIPSDGYSYRTRIKAISAVKSYIDCVYEVTFPDRQRYKVNNIVEGEEPPFDPVIATPREVKEVFDETEECSIPGCHAMVRLSYDAIMRVSELVKVRWDDIDLGRGTIYVRSAKGSPKRHVKLSPKTLEVLSEYRQLVEFDEPEWLFYRLQGYRKRNRWTVQSWSRHFSTLYDAGMHSFSRHSAITNRLNSGETISDVSRRARHANLDNTTKYDQLSDNGHIPDELQ